jgi:hypothetical protein
MTRLTIMPEVLEDCIAKHSPMRPSEMGRIKMFSAQ